MNSLDRFLESFPYQSDEQWPTFNILQPQDTDISSRAGTPAATESAARVELPEKNGATDPLNERTQLPLDKLALLQLSDRDREKLYDEEPPSSIHYSIEWKVTVNNPGSFKGH
jgi:hypothetical protein